MDDYTFEREFTAEKLTFFRGTIGELPLNASRTRAKSSGRVYF
jgi:hypothetical protein